MGDQLENIAAATSFTRRSSFEMLCQQQRRRSTSLPDILPVPVKAPKTRGGCTPRALLLRQAVEKSTALEEGESGSCGTEHEDPSAIATGSGDISDDVDALNELISVQKEDLKTAALIGQRLLDSNDELSAQLEAAKEEKWLVECEKEALRRDLEHATERCEQMQRDTRSDIIVPGEETQLEELDLWSPTAGVAADALLSASEGCWTSSSTALPGASANDNGREKENRQAETEIERLKEEVKNLEQANTSLKEELVEARLEKTALRHTLVERGGAVLDQETRELGAEVRQGVRSGWSDPDVRGKHRENKSDKAGVRQDDGDEASFPSPATVSGGTDARKPAAPAIFEANSGDDSRKEGVNQQRAQKNPNAFVSHRTKVSSDGVGRPAESPPPEVAVPPESLLRRLSSSAFKDAEEQRELIEALRDQISQLQLEKQMRMTHTGQPNNSTMGGESSLGQCDDGAVELSSCSKCSSDDDSGSGGDYGEGSPFGEYQPRGWCPQHIGDGACSEMHASRRRKQSGSDIDSSGEHLDPDQHRLLQERASELSAELEAANKEIEAYREQTQQSQSEILELRICHLSAELEAANKENKALREQAQHNQAESLELRVYQLSADLEAAIKANEALREQAQHKQAEGLELRVGELSAELEAMHKANEALLRERARQYQAIEGLELRVGELSAELEATHKANEALLREQGKQNQAESLELQREILRLQGANDKTRLIAAAVAAHSTYPGNSGESSEQRSGCLKYRGLGWLRWLWITVFRGGVGAEEGMGSRSDDRVHDDTPVDVGSELGGGIDRCWGYRNGRTGRFSMDSRGSLLNREHKGASAGHSIDNL